MDKRTELEKHIAQYKNLGIDQQIDYNKFYLYSIITHSTAIEGSTVTEVENQILFDKGISAQGRSLMEQYMNLDLKNAYERCLEYAKNHVDITIPILKELSGLLMAKTGSVYQTALGEFDSSKGDLRLLNVTAGIGGRSYMSYNKVPLKLAEFCKWLNSERKKVGRKTIYDQYIFTFDAHYELVTIHPWADGNGRMARLLMNMLQFELGLIPSKILSSNKVSYIEALINTRENDDLSYFRSFMTEEMIKNLNSDITSFIQSTGESLPEVKTVIKSREKIIALLESNPNMTTKTIAEAIGISVKAVEKHLTNLKKSGEIERVGPDKGGHWIVN